MAAQLNRLSGQDLPFTWGQEEEAAFQKLKDSITSDDTMVFFIPRKPITLITEATSSFHGGLSAVLFQRTGKGLQPHHYFSRPMTATEQRYSHTEKDALDVKLANQNSVCTCLERQSSNHNDP